MCLTMNTGLPQTSTHFKLFMNPHVPRYFTGNLAPDNYTLVNTANVAHVPVAKATLTLHGIFVTIFGFVPFVFHKRFGLALNCSEVD